ncbi:MAG: YdcF family protein [Acidobacteriota bacterium]|nr:YdcF family protein [Acidobacteriota bacterium]
MKKIVRIFRGLFAAVGILTVLFIAWMAAGLPIFIDRWLVKTEPPVEADYIVCLTNGFFANNIPTEAGFQRIYTSIQLHADGYGKKVVISGGGAGRVTEAEIYGEAAVWMGLPPEALAFDPKSGSTVDHPRYILEAEGVEITRDSNLLIVTSPHHARRVWLCFRKAGYTNYRIVARHTARKAGPEIVRTQRVSEFKEFRPSGKVYDDPILTSRRRVTNLMSALREWAGIAYYKVKGYI